MREFLKLFKLDDRFGRDLAITFAGLGTASLLGFVAVICLHLTGGLVGRGVLLSLLLPLIVIGLTKTAGPTMIGIGLWMILLGPRRWGLALLAAGAGHVAAVGWAEWWIAGPQGLRLWS
ncbi:hypothetical protein [Paludisphaera soli]|uniref:hypothetical protein n=1 Tax=Paludisphaera soli TaxID=2712865 RepID=UPI0013ECAFC0|nr:hypothetical protein [Paludisphaera soli]